MFYVAYLDTTFITNHPTFQECIKLIVDNAITKNSLANLNEFTHFFEDIDVPTGQLYANYFDLSLVDFVGIAGRWHALTCYKAEFEKLISLISQRSKNNFLLTFNGITFTFIEAPTEAELKKVEQYKQSKIYMRVNQQRMPHYFYTNINYPGLPLLFWLLESTLGIQLLFGDETEDINWDDDIDVENSFYSNEIGFTVLKDKMIEIAYSNADSGLIIHKEAYLDCIRDWSNYEKTANSDYAQLITVIVDGKHGRVTFEGTIAEQAKN